MQPRCNPRQADTGTHQDNRSSCHDWSVYLDDRGLPHRVSFCAPGAIKCVECGRRERWAQAADTWRLFRDAMGGFEELCPDCAQEELGREDVELH